VVVEKVQGMTANEVLANVPGAANNRRLILRRAKGQSTKSFLSKGKVVTSCGEYMSSYAPKEHRKITQNLGNPVITALYILLLIDCRRLP